MINLLHIKKTANYKLKYKDHTSKKENHEIATLFPS